MSKKRDAKLLRWIDKRIAKARLVKGRYVVRGQYIDAACAQDYERFLIEFRTAFMRAKD
jgi:hypothetical protein